MAGTQLCLRAPPLSWITRRASRCLCSCGSVTPGGERLGAGGRTCRARPGGKGLGGNCLGGLVWVRVGLAWARYFALSLPTAAAAAAAGEAPLARAGSVPRSAACGGSWRGPLRRWRGLPGPRSQPLARPPRSPLRLRQPSAMRPVPALGLPPVSAACRGPRSGPRRGLLGPRSPLPARLGPPPGAGRQGLLLGRRGRSPRLAQAPGPAAAARPAPPPPPASAPRAPRGSPPSTLGRRGSGSGDRRWWRSSRWGEPSESAITVILVGMRGGRRALPTTSWCISAVPWAVPCGALRGGGGEGVGGRLWRQPRTAGGRRPSIGIGRGGGGAARPTCRATAPSLGRGPGPWAPGGRRVVSGKAALGGPP